MPNSRTKINHPIPSSSNNSINLDVAYDEVQLYKLLELSRYDERPCSYDRFFYRCTYFHVQLQPMLNALGHLDHNQSD